MFIDKVVSTLKWSASQLTPASARLRQEQPMPFSDLELDDASLEKVAGGAPTSSIELY